MPRPALLPAALIAAMAGAGSARADFLHDSLGGWAIGGAENCRVAAKSYQLTTYGGNITWRNGIGDVDIEAVTASDGEEFRTVTVESIHRSGGGYARGTAWTYTGTGPGTMLVSVGQARAFVLTRCF